MPGTLLKLSQCVGRDAPMGRKEKLILRVNVDSAAVPHYDSNDKLGARDRAVR